MNPNDPSQLIIGISQVILAILGVIVAIELYRRNKARKEITYEIIAQSSLLSVQPEIKGKVKILYEDKLVERVHLVVIRLSNSGNQPIKLPKEFTDYERPINISFGSNAQILTVETKDPIPKNLRASVHIENQKIITNPVLLNPKDEFTIEALISEFESPISIDYRIEGVKEIIERKTLGEGNPQTATIALLIIGFSILSMIFMSTLGIISPGFGFFAGFLIFLCFVPIEWIVRQVIRKMR